MSNVEHFSLNHVLFTFLHHSSSLLPFSFYPISLPHLYLCACVCVWWWFGVLWCHANEAIKIEYPEWIFFKKKTVREPLYSVGICWAPFIHSTKMNFISKTELTNRIIFSSNMIITNDDVMLTLLVCVCVCECFWSPFFYLFHFCAIHVHILDFLIFMARIVWQKRKMTNALFAQFGFFFHLKNSENPITNTWTTVQLKNPSAIS